MAECGSARIVVGRVTGVFGVQGWVKIRSYTEPRDNILRYAPWELSMRGTSIAPAIEGGRPHANAIVAKLQGYDDRDQARLLVGADITVPRAVLPRVEADEYYWADLVGLTVRTQDGVDLGQVDHLLETGANDVLVVAGERERLIPFTLGDVVLDVDLEKGCLTVDWDPDY